MSDLLEEHLKKVADKGHITPSEHRWESIRHRLNKNRKKRSRMRWITGLSVAAGFALLIVFTIGYVLPGLSSEKFRSTKLEELPVQKTQPIIVSRMVYSGQEFAVRDKVFRLYRPENPPKPQKE